MRHNSVPHQLPKGRFGYLRRILKRERMIAGKKPWYSFDTGLAQLKKEIHIDPMAEVRTHQGLMRDPQYTYLDLGAGSGRTASEAEQFLNSNPLHGEVKVIATGIKERMEWKSHSNSNKINWKTVEFEKLSRVVPANSINFILSHFGIGHAQNLSNALNEVHKVLKKGGRILYSYDAPYTAPHLCPKGFKSVKKYATIYQAEPNEDSQYVRVVMYLEKI